MFSPKIGDVLPVASTPNSNFHNAVHHLGDEGVEHEALFWHRERAARISHQLIQVHQSWNLQAMESLCQ